jgi:putative tryptophan/tyrosine transport system substrate-binding protein
MNAVREPAALANGGARPVIAILVALLLLAAPFTSYGQPTAKVSRIGLLMHDGTPPNFLEEFRAGLKELGYVEGQNVALELRNAQGNSDHLIGFANELVRLRVDLIVALNTPAAIAAKNATSTIPIVIARVSDPMQSGLVKSLARPGGNVTGLSFNNSELAVKGLELLHEALPQITRIAVLSNAWNAAHNAQVSALISAGERKHLKIHSIPLNGPAEQRAAFQAAGRLRAEAIFVLDDTSLTRQRSDIIKLATAQSLPVVSRYADFADAGALIAYGPKLQALYRRAAYYVDRLLRGARASDLPLEEPSVFDLVVNVKTARSLGLTISHSVLVRADRVIN